MTQTDAKRNRTGKTERAQTEVAAQKPREHVLGSAEDESRILLLAVEHTADSIMISDNTGTVLYANPAFETLTGYTRSEVVGQNVSIFRSGHHPESFYARMRRIVRAGRVFRAVFVSRTKSGTLYSEDKTLTPIPNEAGEVTHFVSTGRDVTATQRARDLELRLKAAEDAEALKTNLLSTVSHELRTPLAAILSYTTAILDYGESLGPTKVYEYLKNVESRSRQLGRLIDDLLTMSRLESGNLPFEPEDCLLTDLLAETIEDWRLRGTLHIERELPEDPLFVHADVTRIREVLQNLLENAEKHSGLLGQVTISARPSPNNQVEITVRDHGRGVEAEELDAIFDRFYRTRAEGTNMPGAGLGLSICRGIVEAHGGSIYAFLPPGGGLAIAFTVPSIA